MLHNHKRCLEVVPRKYISDEYEFSITFSETYINEYNADCIIKNVNEIQLKLKNYISDKNVNYLHYHLTF